MELSLFRKNFAHVPRHVAVLGLNQGSEIQGVTISSLQSVSVNEQKQILTFVLKKDSSFSRILIESGEMTINFLADNQEEISKAYSDKDRNGRNEFKAEVWLRSERNLVFIKGAAFSLSATFLNLIELEDSNIFFVSADDIIESNERKILMYSDRSYGAFQHRKFQ